MRTMQRVDSELETITEQEEAIRGNYVEQLDAIEDMEGSYSFIMRGKDNRKSNAGSIFNLTKK